MFDTQGERAYDDGHGRRRPHHHSSASDPRRHRTEHPRPRLPAVGARDRRVDRAHVAVDGPQPPAHARPRLGYLRRDPNKPRAIEVRWDPNSGAVMERRPVRHVPLVGDVAAGTDVLAVEQVEEIYPLPVDFTGEGDLFMLRVRGESMIEAGILDGDYVVAVQQNKAQQRRHRRRRHPGRRGHHQALHGGRRRRHADAVQLDDGADDLRRRRGRDLRPRRHRDAPALTRQADAPAVTPAGVQAAAISSMRSSGWTTATRTKRAHPGP